MVRCSSRGAVVICWDPSDEVCDFCEAARCINDGARCLDCRTPLRCDEAQVLGSCGPCYVSSSTRPTQTRYGQANAARIASIEPPMEY